MDRAARKLRPIFIVGAGLCLPAFLVSYAKMLSLAFEAWPTWAWVSSCASQIVVIVGLAMLHDSQKEKRTP